MRINLNHFSYRSLRHPRSKTSRPYTSGEARAWTMSAASRLEARARSAPIERVAACDGALAFVALSSYSAGSDAGVFVGSGHVGEDAMNGPEPGQYFAKQRGKAATCFFGSSFESSERTWGRSAIATASSSPPIATSSMAFRIPSFEENNRYTVACGVSERSLIASMVVAA